MEYNAKFAPPLQYCMAYNATHVWSGDDCFGVSLKLLEIALMCVETIDWLDTTSPARTRFLSARICLKKNFSPHTLLNDTMSLPATILPEHRPGTRHRTQRCNAPLLGATGLGPSDGKREGLHDRSIGAGNTQRLSRRPLRGSSPDCQSPCTRTSPDRHAFRPCWF